MSKRAFLVNTDPAAKICLRCGRWVSLFKNGIMRPHKKVIDTGKRSGSGMPLSCSVALGDWCKVEANP